MKKKAIKKVSKVDGNFKVEVFHTILTSDEHGQVIYNFKKKEEADTFLEILREHKLIK